MRTCCPVARLADHIGETVVRYRLVVEQRTYHQITAEPMKFGSGTFWWGEATDEPARADARPTGKFNLYHYLKFLTLADWTGVIEMELFALDNGWGPIHALCAKLVGTSRPPSAVLLQRTGCDVPDRLRGRSHFGVAKVRAERAERISKAAE